MCIRDRFLNSVRKYRKYRQPSITRSGCCFPIDIGRVLLNDVKIYNNKIILWLKLQSDDVISLLCELDTDIAAHASQQSISYHFPPYTNKDNGEIKMKINLRSNKNNFYNGGYVTSSIVHSDFEVGKEYNIQTCLLYTSRCV